ncbi:NAD(P)/FAD-dependent oxidoreductase [Roseisalinus antarcticus]|uniref:Hydrogen cyanide synthase subunit HcnC n=1 Tax=Roseisalinus antarcticus TaxID=254357 RepID=A0A1Y5SDB6_9RHOB|nr:FAD-binding oxidoreductase [Roseisalinus antarcticus]SLN38144.1 Hydrogen cyanide synthase subunit HcnC precursor [Roseisalinus antarcticus]
MRDFLVIGGGIAGVSAAARLSHLGSVILLERESALAFHASGRSAALFEANYGQPPVVALNAASEAYHETANGGVLSPRGLMLIGTAVDAAGFAEDIRTMGLDQITIEEARAFWPILAADVDRAGFHDSARDIDTDRLLQNFAREARSNGAEFHTDAGVTAIRRTSAGWQVDAGGETHAARILVNAAGAWVDNVATMAGIAPIGFTPLRRSMARIPAPEGHDVSRWPMVFGIGEGWYAKPDAGALIVSPAEEDPVEPQDAWADDMVLAEGLARYEAHVTVPVTRMLANWAGLRTFAPDRNLVLGPAPTDPAFVWCAGQGGYGFQSCPAASALLADLVAGRSPALPVDVVSSLSPERFAT